MLKRFQFKHLVLLGSVYLCLGFAFQACTPRQEYSEMPIPNAKMAVDTGTSLDQLGKGYALSQVHCSQCHVFKLPKDMRVEEWHTIVPGMAWNAGLDKQDEAAVMAYLVAATEQMPRSRD
ncbi:MAG: hypothetical protein ACPIA7_09100 [Akkermansiaceae bacterium]